MDEDEKLRYPIGRENEQKVYDKEFDEPLKSTLINDLRMLQLLQAD